MILVGDCVELMRGLEPASVDAIVTDPPYGLEFMGKEWDSFKTYAGGNPNIKPQGQTVGEASGVTYGYRQKNPRCRRCGKLQRGNGACKCPVGGDWSYRHDESGFQAQAWHEQWATEALRVLKPGGHLLAFGGTRTYHRLACAIEDAGFEIRDCLAWMFGSGFPKSLDVSKAIDKAAGVERGSDYEPNHGNAVYGNGMGGGLTTRSDPPATDDARTWQGWGTALKPAFEPVVVARKPLAGTVAGNVLAHGTGALNVDGCRVEAETVGTGNLAQNTHLRSSVKRGEGMFVGADEAAMSPLGRWPANVVLDEAWEPVLCLRYTLSDDAWQVLSEWCRARNGDVPAMRGATRRAALPSEAPEVLLASVPPSLDVREHSRNGSPDEGQEALAGVDSEDERHEEGPSETAEAGALHAQGLRLHPRGGNHAGTTRASSGDGAGSRATADTGRGRPPHQRGEGRQPASEPRATRETDAQDDARGVVPGTAAPSRPRREVLLRDVPAPWLAHFEFSGDVVNVGSAAMLDEQTGERLHAAGNRPHSLGPEAATSPKQGTSYNVNPEGWGPVSVYDDRGGASRFFYTAKSSRAERNAGLEGFEEQAVSALDDRPSGDHDQRRGLREGPRMARNTHPTVKPVALMRWLVRLVTPPGGTVLDPFAGSGTTGIAAALEGFQFLGMEQDAEYAKIAEARIAFWTKHGEEGLRIVAERERAEAEREEMAALGQIGLFEMPAELRSGSNGREGEASAERRYTDRGSTNFAPKPGRRRK